MNKIMIAGHLGADPEVRFTAGNLKVTTLRVACRARSKEKKDDTIWWKVAVWGEDFAKLIPHMKKGSAVIIYGEMGKPEIYTNKQGVAAVSMELVARDISFSPFGKPEGQQSNDTGQTQYQKQASTFEAQSTQRGQGQAQMVMLDEEIPF